MIPIEIRFNFIGVPKDKEVPSDTSSAKSTVQVRVLVDGLDAYTERNCFPYTGGFPRQALWEVGHGRWSEEVGLPE